MRRMDEILRHRAPIEKPAPERTDAASVATNPTAPEKEITFTQEEVLKGLQEMLEGSHLNETERADIQARIDALTRTNQEKGE
jgi:hypothetical protein